MMIGHVAPNLDTPMMNPFGTGFTPSMQHMLLNKPTTPVQNFLDPSNLMTMDNPLLFNDNGSVSDRNKGVKSGEGKDSENKFNLDFMLKNVH